VTVSIQKFRIIARVLNRIEYWSNYSIWNFEYSIHTALLLFQTSSWLLAGSVCDSEYAGWHSSNCVVWVDGCWLYLQWKRRDRWRIVTLWRSVCGRNLIERWWSSTILSITRYMLNCFRLFITVGCLYPWTVYHCMLLVSLDCLSLYAACMLGLFITVCCLYPRTVYHCMLLVSSDCLSL